MAYCLLTPFNAFNGTTDKTFAVGWCARTTKNFPIARDCCADTPNAFANLHFISRYSISFNAMVKCDRIEEGMSIGHVASIRLRCVKEKYFLN